MSRRFLIFTLLITLLGASPLWAGNPLFARQGTAVVHTSPLTWNMAYYSTGETPTGLSQSAAATLMQEAFEVWSAPTLGGLSLSQGSDQTITPDNFANLISDHFDGTIPIIWDDDGALLQAHLGEATLLKLVAEGVPHFNEVEDVLEEGFILVNGAKSADLDRNSLKLHLVRAAGRLLGLGWSQVQGDFDSNHLADLAVHRPVMFPTVSVYQEFTALHEDDLATIIHLYGSSAAKSSYATISGQVLDSADSPVNGVNLVAIDLDNPETHRFSVVSNHLNQGLGLYELVVPAGSYKIKVEPVNGNFVGTKAVGRHAKHLNDLSFVDAPQIEYYNSSESASESNLEAFTEISVNAGGSESGIDLIVNFQDRPPQYLEWTHVWNMVQLPITASQSSSSYFSGKTYLKRVWYWDSSLNDSSGGWKTFPLTDGFEFLDTVQPNQGYWFHLTQKGGLRGFRAITAESYALASGYNLVSVRSGQTPIPVEVFLGTQHFTDQNGDPLSSSPVNRAWYYDQEEGWLVWSPSQTISEINTSLGVNLHGLEAVQPGTSIWIQSTAAVNFQYEDSLSNLDLTVGETNFGTEGSPELVEQDFPLVLGDAQARVVSQSLKHLPNSVRVQVQAVASSGELPSVSGLESKGTVVSGLLVNTYRQDSGSPLADEATLAGFDGNIRPFSTQLLSGQEFSTLASEITNNTNLLKWYYYDSSTQTWLPENGLDARLISNLDKLLSADVDQIAFRDAHYDDLAESCGLRFFAGMQGEYGLCAGLNSQGEHETANQLYTALAFVKQSGAEPDLATASCGSSSTVSFSDANFEACLRQHAPLRPEDGLSADASIPQNRLCRVRYLNCVGQSITTVEHLRYLENLDALNLSNNAISSIEIKGMPHLSYLDLSLNQLNSLDLKHLDHLRFLNLEGNLLNNLQLPKYLPGLAYVNVTGNSVAELPLEYWHQLQVLKAGYSDLSSLDLSHLSQLQELYLEGLSLTSLDVSGLTNLELLSLQENSLSALNISGLSKLVSLNVSGNSLLSCDGGIVTSGTANPTNTALPLHCRNDNTAPTAKAGSDQQVASGAVTLDGSGSSDVEGAIAAYEWSLISQPGSGFTLETTNTASISFTPSDKGTYQFRLKVTDSEGLVGYDQVELEWGEHELNNSQLLSCALLNRSETYITPTLAASITSLDCSNQDLTSLDGIEQFTNLETLDATSNNLTSLSLSSHPSLKSLNLQFNQITTASISDMPELEEINLKSQQEEGDQLSDEQENLLTSITFSNLPNLKIVNLGDNSLTSLDVSMLANLEELDVSLNEEMTALDLSNNPKLTVIDIEVNKFTELDLSNNPLLTQINANFNDISNLTLPPTTAPLKKLELGDSELTSIDLSGFTGLTGVSLNSNNLTTLDVSALTQLETLFLQSNQLTSISMNGLDNLTTFLASGNDSLSCADLYLTSGLEAITLPTACNSTNRIPKAVAGDDLEGSGTVSLDGSGSIDYENSIDTYQWQVISQPNGSSPEFTNSSSATTSFSSDTVGQYVLRLTVTDTAGASATDELTLHYNYRLLSDANLHACAQSISGLSVITESVAAGMDSLLCSGVTIASTQGLEHFTGLTTLVLNETNLFTIDLSALTNLSTLDLNNNLLDSIDLSAQTSLTELNLSDNDLTSLDLANNSNLTQLTLSNNELRVLDIGNLTQLTFLSLDDNHLQNLDLSNNTLLETLNLEGNEFLYLDLSSLSALKFLVLNSNNLVALDVSNNVLLQSLELNNNSLATLDLSGLANLLQLEADNNQIYLMDIPDSSNLSSLSAQNNQLWSFSLGVNSLTSLSLSDNDSLNCAPLSVSATVRGEAGCSN